MQLASSASVMFAILLIYLAVLAYPELQHLVVALPTGPVNLQIVVLHKLTEMFKVALGGWVCGKNVQHVAACQLPHLVFYQHKRFRTAQSSSVDLNVVVQH